jgi:hypothetical protein
MTQGSLHDRRLRGNLHHRSSEEVGRTSAVSILCTGSRRSSCMNQLIESRTCSESSNAEIPKLGPTLWSSPRSRAWSSGLEWCLLALLVVAFAGYDVAPGWQALKSEFPNYYLAAELYHHGIKLDRVYEWTWFQRQNDQLGVHDGLVSFAPNPPTLVLSLIPFARLQPLAAKRAWLVLSLVLLGLSLWILHRVTSLTWRRLTLVGLLCVLPLNVDFVFARHYVLILFLICAAYSFARIDRHWTSGAIWSAAAALKLFPALVVILFVRKRNWRAVGGFVVGAISLVALSVRLFGIEVHRVFFREVLSQASRGDWLGPYALSQNSFITLWSHLFLIEPELNPSPLINSPILYSLALAITVTVLILGFLWSISVDNSRHTSALHWAALVPLLLLLSTTTAPDYSCLLIFTVIVAFDVFLAIGKTKKAFALLVLYVVACAPISDRMSHWLPLSRLVATTALYALLTQSSGEGRRELLATRWLAVAVMSVAMLTFYNFQAVRSRTEDFSRRLPIPGTGYRFANPVPVADGVAFTEMKPSKYAAAIFSNGVVSDIPMSGDALSVAGSEASTWLYSELTGHKSVIVRLPFGPGASPETLAEGQEPALSHNGKWLAFIREEQGEGRVELLATGSHDAPQTVLPSAYQPLDITVADDGDVIAGAGNVSDPHLLLVRHETRDVEALPGFHGPARYPSVSPDGKRLAFSRRDRGSWHLFVRNFATGDEQQLTHTSCNATSPSWINTQTLLYATDCGRGVGLSAIARVVVPN